ncbi:ensconsin [Lampris incognitus]|uniref:ensconsin n=1 Tax=Lampris incognitus TaxID=2546036 RepID=UPI0024B57585|nr:ensconsin [Lampris incognitus]
MPDSLPSMAVQKKQIVIPPPRGPLSVYTIDSQKKKNGSKTTAERGNDVKPNPQTKKTVCSPSVVKSAQMCNTTGPRITAGASGTNIDERLRLARKRREEHEKVLASRELSRLEREQRAKRYHEQQLEERKKRLLEQRMKEERRRSAVEQKRKQKLEEEIERYELAVRKTQEKSERALQGLLQNARGRKPAKNNVPRRLPLTTWEKNLVSRLLTPTCSYLARSKSAACYSGEEVVHVCRRSVSCHSMNTTTPHKPQHHPGPAHHRTSASPSPSNSSHRSISLSQTKPGKRQDGSNVNKKNTTTTTKNKINSKSPITNARVKPAQKTQSRTGPPSPERTPRKPVSRHATPLQLELPSVPEEPPACCRDPSPVAASPSRTLPSKVRRVETKDTSPTQTPRPGSAGSHRETVTRTEPNRSSFQIPAPAARQSPVATNRPSAGTTDPEEASRLLAEKRRQARLQREKEEQERLQREEKEARSREELERRRVEEQERLEAEAQRLVEEKRRREEEEQRRAEEERAQAMREAALLQKQRDEEQAKEREKEEQMKQERELLVQKEEAERQARKKRLEEIMRRTRRSDPTDRKSVPVRILPKETEPKENTEPAQNGAIEEADKLLVGSKPSQLGLNGVEDMVPVVAFKERRSLRALAGLEEIQTHQRAEVI